MQSHMNKSTADGGPLQKDAIFIRPSHIMMVTLLVVFVAEALVMLILGQFQQINVYVEALVDSVFLSAIIFPLLYILLLRPLRLLALSYRQALLEVKTLKGLLSICMKCKKIHLPDSDEYDQDSWQHIETYIEDHSETEFSHGLCPECYKVWRKEMGLDDVDT